MTLLLLPLLPVLAQDEAPKPLPIAELSRDKPVHYATEVFPVIRKNCIACHSSSKRKAKLNLETVATIKEGAGGDPVIIPGKPEDSLLFITAAHLEEPIMPPEDNKADAHNLKPKELALLRQWIKEGCKGEAPSAADKPLNWAAIHTNIAPIIAADIGPLGLRAAVGRGVDLVVYNLHTGETDFHAPAAHRDLIQAISVGPQQQIASGGYQTLKIWQRSAQQLIHDWEMPAGISALTSSSDGQRFAAGDANGHVSVWSATNAYKLAVQKRHGGKVTGLAFLKNGELLSASEDKTLKRLSATLEEKQKWDLPHPASALALSADQLHVFTGGGDNLIRAWQLGGTNHFELTGHQKPVTHLLAIGEQLLAADQGNRVHQWNLKEKKSIRQLDSGGPIRSLTLNKDASHIAVATADHLRTWQVADGKALPDQKGRIADRRGAAALAQHQALSTKLRDTRSKDRDAKVKKRDEEAKKLSASGTAFAQASAALNKAATALRPLAQAKAGLAARIAALGEGDSPEKKRLQEQAKKSDEALKNPQKAFDEAQSKHKAARLNRESALRLSQRAAAAALEAEAHVAVLEEEKKQLEAAKVELDKQIAAAASPFKQVISSGDKLLATSEDGRLQSFGLKESGDQETLQQLPNNTSLLHPLPDGRFLAGNESKQIQLIDPRARWTATTTITGLVDRVRAIAFSPDGSRIAIGCGIPSRSGVVQVRETSSGNLLWENDEAHTDTISGLAFAPDGQTLASASTDRFVKTWKTDTGTHIQDFEGHTAYVMDIAWSADGLLLASAGADHVVKLWNAEEGTQKQSIDGFSKEITGIQFLGNEQQFVVSAADKTVRIGKDARLPEVKDAMYTCAVSPDGKWIIAGGQDRRLVVWGSDRKLKRVFE